MTKFGHADVIQSALFHVQVHRDIEVLSVAYDCTFKFLQKTIPVKEPAKYDAWDELTKKVGSMQFQNYVYGISYLVMSSSRDFPSSGAFQFSR